MFIKLQLYKHTKATSYINEICNIRIQVWPYFNWKLCAIFQELGSELAKHQQHLHLLQQYIRFFYIDPEQQRDAPMTPIDFEERERMLMRFLAQITERKVNSYIPGFLYWNGHYRNLSIQMCYQFSSINQKYLAFKLFLVKSLCLAFCMAECFTTEMH
jgi:hypothetical protein